MRVLKFIYLLPLIAPLIGCNNNDRGMIDVASYVDITGQKACSDKIQELINNNPHRTLYFRDGTYLLNHQILTPGDPDKAVDLQLSNFAILKASEDYQVFRTGTKEKWQDDYLYMVSLGGLDRENHLEKVCSRYSLTGGIIDGSGKAAGIEIAGGRETHVQNSSLRNVEIGVRIAPGVNGSGSSDADLRDLSIVCNDKVNSYGLRIDGLDNSATNIRIGHTYHGVYVCGGTALLKNIHPLNTGTCLNSTELYNQTVGFEINGFCELNSCYSDNFRTGFKFNNNRAFLTDCIAWWWKPGGDEVTDHEQCCIYCESDEFNATINNFVTGFKRTENQHIMQARNNNIGGKGLITNIRSNLINTVQDLEKVGDKYMPKEDSILNKYFYDFADRGVLPN